MARMYACIFAYFLCTRLMKFRSSNLYPRSIQNQKHETQSIKKFDSGPKKGLEAIFFLSLLGTWNSTSFWPLLSGYVKYSHSKISSNRCFSYTKNRSLYIHRRLFYCRICRERFFCLCADFIVLSFYFRLSNPSFIFAKLCNGYFLLPSDCPTLPLSLPNGMVSGTGSVEGSYYYFSCQKHYSLLGANTLFCNKKGTWNGSVPACFKGR